MWQAVSLGTVRGCVTTLALTLALPCRLAKKLVYGKIRGALGVSKCVVSGGGSLQPHLDEFYEVLDLTVLNGWGLSEVTAFLLLPSDSCLLTFCAGPSREIVHRMISPERQ